MFHVKLFYLILLVFPLFSEAQHLGSAILEIRKLPALPPIDKSIEALIKSFKPELNSNAKEWFYWVNYSRANPKRFWDSVVVPLLDVYPSLKGVNSSSLKEDLYGAHSLPLVKPNLSLTHTAQMLASDLAANKSKPSHTTSTGLTFADRMKDNNIRKCAGENISFGPSNSVLMLVMLFLDNGVADLGHRRSLLQSSYEEMGIGRGAYPNNQFIIVQDFACQQ